MRGLSRVTSKNNFSPRIWLTLAAVFVLGHIPPTTLSDAHAQKRDEPAAGESISKARQPSRAWRNDATASRMRRLGKAMNLLTVGDFPVIGELPKGLPKNPGLQILADRLTLYLHPEILQPGMRVGNIDIRAMAIRLLGIDNTKLYITLDGKAWRGADEFQRKRSKEAFYKDQARVLKKLALKPPFRFRTINRAKVSQYDFGNERFAIDWQGDQKSGVLRLSFAGTKQQKLLEKLALPQSMTFPRHWALTPTKAEQISGLLRSVNNRERGVYVSSVFDVIDQTDPQTAPDSPIQWGAQFEIRPRHSAIYSDITCKNTLWEFPLVLPPAGMLVSRELQVPQEDPLYLWQPEVQVALAANANAAAVKRNDWLAAALSIYQEDIEYYEHGTSPSRKIQGSDRAGLLPAVGSSNRPTAWDDSYLPFFPSGFFGGGKLDVAAISKRKIRASQLTLLKRWMKSRIEAASGEFRLECRIRVDRDSNVAGLFPGVSSQESLELDFPKRKDFGHIGLLKSPKQNVRGNSNKVDPLTSFAVAYPALAYHMNFAIDANSLPPTNTDETIQIYSGDLIVKVVDTQWVTSVEVPQVLLHIDPVRFEALRKLPQTGIANRKADGTTKVAFSLPISVAPYNGHDLARDQAAARALELAKQAEVEQQRIAQREKLRQEQEAKRQKAKADLARKRALEKENSSLKMKREQIARMQERGEIDQARANAMLKEQIEMEQGRERVKFARQEARKRANKLLEQGYTQEQIDWETGTLRPEASSAGTEIRTWPLLFAITTAFAGLLAVVGWRWRRGSLQEDINQIKEQIFGSSRTYKPKSRNRRLAKIDIPNAKKKLGQEMYHHGVGEEEFSNIYRELRQIYSQLAKLQPETNTSQSTDLGDSSSENALATYYATSQGMALELQNQLAESKLKSRRRAAFTYLADRLLEDPQLDPRGQFERQIANINMMHAELIGKE